MNCISCLSPIEQERLSLGLQICCVCAKRLNPPRVKGYMHYSHKTAATLALTTPEAFANFKRDTDRKGQSSILRNKMVSGGRLV